MQRLIIKSIHEHGFGFAFTHKEHDQVYLPRKLLSEAGITSLKPADEIIGEVIPNYIDKLDGGCKYICTEIGYAHRHIEPEPRDFSKDIELIRKCHFINQDIDQSNEEKLRYYLPKLLSGIDPDLHRILFAEIDRPSLPVRTYNLLRNEFDHINWNMEIYNYDLLSYTPANLLRFPNFGRGSLGHVENHLSKFGLKLGTPLEEIKQKAKEAVNRHLNKKLAHIWEGE